MDCRKRRQAVKTRLMSTNEPIVSPCVRVCAVDGMRGQCVGCGRTLREIAGWSGYSPAERAAIMAALPARMAALPAVPGAL
jgi:uncharacterized protein